MKLPARIATEALVVLAGAVLAAWIIGRAPGLREWIGQQWGRAPAGRSCDC